MGSLVNADPVVRSCTILGAARMGQLPLCIGLKQCIYPATAQIVLPKAGMIGRKLLKGRCHSHGLADRIGHYHSSAAIGIELAKRIRPGVLVKKDIDARKGNLAIIAGIHSAQVSKSRIHAKPRTHGRIGAKRPRHLVHDAVHTLGGLFKKRRHVLVEYLWRQSPGRRIAVVERMGLRQVLVAFATTRQVTFALAHDALKIIFKLSRLRCCHVTLHCSIFCSCYASARGFGALE